MYQPVIAEPEIITETFCAGEPVQKQCFRVVVSGDEWQLCNNIKRWSESKTGDYGGGIGNTKDDPRRVTRVGCLGEMAFAKMLGLPFDDEFKDMGDNYDFRIHKKKIDVKTSIFRGNEIGLVRCQEGLDRFFPITMDCYVFSYRESEDREIGTASIVFCGWQDRGWVEKRSKAIGSGRNAIHFNKECHFARLRPIYSLYKWAKNI